MSSMVFHKRWSPQKLERLSRRGFLGMSAASAALLPFVPMLEREVEAAGTPCQRLVVFHCPNGSILRNWRIEGLAHGDPLPDDEAGFSEILRPLAGLRDKMVVLDGIDSLPTAYAAQGLVSMVGKGHHASGSIWTQQFAEAGGPATCDNGASCQWPGGPSLDQWIAEQIADQTPYKALYPNVRAHATDRQGNMFYDTNGQPVVGENKPRVLFDQLFADLNLDPTEKARLKAQRKSVIDSVKGDLDSLQLRLGAGDRQRLEAHLTGIKELEDALDGLDVQCEIPQQPDELDPRDNANLPLITDLQIEIIANALACDLTRVVGFKWGREGSTGVATWLGQNSGIHTTSHWEGGSGEAQSIQWMTDLNAWWAEKFAALANRLQEKNILDETLLVWSNTMCEGNAHNARNIPMVLIQGNGYFETGRYLKYGNFPSIVPVGQVPSNEDYGGESMNRFATSLCHAMGFEDVDSFGNPEFGTGPLPDL